MITSTPISRARLTGRLSTSPPSTSRRPSISTGASTPGADMLARSTVARSPERSTTGSPVSRSVASARNGVGSWSKSCWSPMRSVAVRSTCVIFCPCTSPSGSVTPSPSRKPSAPRARKLRSSCLRRNTRSRRGARSRSRSCQSSVRNTSVISSPSSPAAYRPPMTAPMLVPATASMGMRISSSAWITPTCAAPRAPPPLSTSPMRGRSGAACGCRVRCGSPRGRPQQRAGARGHQEVSDQHVPCSGSSGRDGNKRHRRHVPRGNAG